MAAKRRAGAERLDVKKMNKNDAKKWLLAVVDLASHIERYVDNMIKTCVKAERLNEPRSKTISASDRDGGLLGRCPPLIQSLDILEIKARLTLARN